MGVDLSAYLARVGLSTAPAPDRAGLFALHRAHATHVPFENLDIQMGLPIRLDLESLQDKLVRRRRGGYCFEHNSLFLAVLREIGFDVEPWEARVRLGATEVRPRTHMLLRVRVENCDWLADVGFGGQGPLAPVALDGAVSEQESERYRVIHEGAVHVLQWREGDAWLDLYAFEPGLRYPVDYEMASHFTSTHPRSHFVQTLTAQRRLPGERHVLRGLAYQIWRGAELEERTLRPDEVLALLRDVFGLVVPDGALPLPRA
jgi:N-hydroxyarylamine O-acetyltransferase